MTSLKKAIILRYIYLTLKPKLIKSNKLTGTQHHHNLILHSSCHVQRLLVVATEVEQGTNRIGNERPLVITGALTARTVTQREISFHCR